MENFTCTVKPKNARPLATLHISQMVLPDAFGQYRVKFFHNILGKLRFLRYYEKI